ncbi:hypothetical protein A3H80_01600 [Candidatus Roizmanbacteria bacterium RIFCSPLOWO2_02_FULL_37_19]|uniref:ATP-grasp domain-containing protein n=1 Tax=Candidatus Roizmanbacteria bacterium RIFCSPHIGHO2_02_FULL_37_24 TaxID=1802037 RepID=A0A1F7H108_9BACT|nr:MAG: hypothetical protein A2862_04495 [Candidatus Roizmanbacteria bacterium RIFCSPHIGHO2_01_FULL_38_41]OGK24614.1 MAG: hypothetical protein A3C24_02380 [Candidatus Roizmanbacteria bacterium RIFCSPHIGHO2_02_FULL_37_24]OGK32252.1 MAG: hypothetical protein A3E10_02320 [Candidatus Roizmanbacteria bacterium RIFCSPHIGHO2_12_FULL_37_23]OGK45546.1 MAG: hypothetical protein A2956_03090 [Candidatus Roizmanbacteria bacterium RIFCSPLOWO2_01_FULL_37_57]OGK53885.1 MAG: hypothetical protein A3H80_01600 [Ca
MIPNILRNKNRILGINERNFTYVRKYNSRVAALIADNKIITKEVLQKGDIPTTKIFKTIKNFKELENLDFSKLPTDFVIKPVKGVEGGGIEIIYNRDKSGHFIGTQSKRLTESGIKLFMTDILEGKFSHSYTPDQILIEERVKPHKKFRPFIYKGTPDIRVIIFRTVPIMAMIRWPTQDSNGKANLSQGAAASGVDLATGITTHTIKATKEGQIHFVDFVQNERIRYSGFKIPFWDKILTNASKASKIAGLGYCAVDFLVDKEDGPLVVELNARPGLSIQLANQDGLKWRLEQVKHLQIKSMVHAIRLGKDLFGGQVEEEIEAIAGKKLISIIQPVKLYSKSGKKSVTIKAKVDTGAFYSSLDTEIAKELGYKDAIDLFKSYNVPETMNSEKEARQWKEKLHEELLAKNPSIVNTHTISSSSGHSYRIAVELKCRIGEKPLDLEINVKDRSQLTFPMLLGRKDLKEFLIDPTKKILNV